MLNYSNNNNIFEKLETRVLSKNTFTSFFNKKFKKETGNEQ